MSKVFVRSYFVAKDEPSYEKALAGMAVIARSAESTPQVKGFAVCVVNKEQHGLLPSNDDPLTIMVVERYSESIISGQSMPLDSELFKVQTTVTSKPGINLTRSSGQSQDSYIITASFLYQFGRATDALKGWKDFVEYMEKTESETYNYSVFQSLDTLSTFEVYSNPEYVAAVHLKSPAVAKNGEQNGQWRVKQGINATRWHLKAGFLYRD